jgi:hypothetical protein
VKSSRRGCGNRGAAGSYLKQNYEMLAERARDPDRLWRGRHDDTRVSAEAQPEHQHVPGFWIPPAGYLIAPSGVVLWSAQTLRLIGAVGCRNGPVRPRQPALCWLVLRPLLRWPDRQKTARAGREPSIRSCAPRATKGRLTQPTAATQAWGREPLFMPQSRHPKHSGDQRGRGGIVLVLMQMAGGVADDHRPEGVYRQIA